MINNVYSITKQLTIMKKIFALLVLALSIGSAHAFSGNDKVINKNQLPAQAQSFINEYFAGAKISYAKLETDFLVNSYEVMLADGTSQNDILAATKMNPYRLKLYLGAAKRFTPEKANAILSELARVDTGAKYGGVTGYTAIELFISKCL